MSKYLILIPLFIPVFLIAQPVDFRVYRIENGTRKDSGANAFKKIINQQFSSLVTGQGKNMFGSFGAVDINAGEVAFAGSHVSRSTGSVLNVKGSGGISDGFHSIFSNSVLNTGISLDIQYHFLSLRKRMLEYDADSADQFNEKIDKLEYDFKAKTIEIEARLDSVNLEKKCTKTIKQIADLEDSVKISYKDPSKLPIFRMELEKAKLLLDSVQSALDNLPYYKTLNRNLRNKTLDKLEALGMESGITGFAFGWFSVGYKVNNNKFKTFNGVLPLGLQVMDTSFVSHAVRLQYSKYYLRSQAFKSYFWDIGLNFTYADNFSSLKKKEISETTEYGTVPGQRQVTKKYNVYEGKYKKDLKGLTMYGDLYYFLFRNNFAAIHLNPEWVISSEEKPVANLYTGFLVAVKSAKTANAVVNAELYYKFLDLFKTTESEYDLFERNSVGIRFVFPIAFKYNKID